MQTSDRSMPTNHGLLEEGAHFATSVALASHRVVARLLLSILGSGLIVVGPATLRTVADASLVSIQILVGLGKLGFAAFQIFGK